MPSIFQFMGCMLMSSDGPRSAGRTWSCECDVASEKQPEGSEIWPMMCCCVYFHTLNCSPFPKDADADSDFGKGKSFFWFLKKKKVFYESAWLEEHLLSALYCSIRLTESINNVLKGPQTRLWVVLIFWLLAILQNSSSQTLCCGFLCTGATLFTHNSCFNLSN